jgi:hypothetical protein
MTDAECRCYTDLFASLVGCKLALDTNLFSGLKTAAKDRFRGKQNDSGLAGPDITQAKSFAYRKGSRRQDALDGYIAPQQQRRRFSRTSHQRPDGDNFPGHGNRRQDGQQRHRDTDYLFASSRCHERRRAFHPAQSNIGRQALGVYRGLEKTLFQQTMRRRAQFRPIMQYWYGNR